MPMNVHPLWIDNAYECPLVAFEHSLDAGTAINLTHVSNTLDFKWDWLDYVANIDDIIEDNKAVTL